MMKPYSYFHILQRSFGGFWGIVIDVTAEKIDRFKNEIHRIQQSTEKAEKD